MTLLTTDFFENESQALRHTDIVLRDSLGTLAVQILASREDISNMEYDDLLVKLHTIIVDLHKMYHWKNGDFT